jgi:hypothetical protein
MTVGEFVLLIGLLANAAAIVFAAWLNASKLKIVLADVRKVELATNGMKNELLAATKSAALQQGNSAGRADLKAEQERDADRANK